MGVSKWFNKNIPRMRAKKERLLEKKRSATVIMANSKGVLEEYKLPPDLKELLDEKKLKER